MGDSLVGTNRCGPDLALLGVIGGLGDRVPADTAADGADEDALGVQPGEDLSESATRSADHGVLVDVNVVEEDRELLVGRHD